MQETRFRSLSRKDPLEKEMATHSSVLAGRIPGTAEPGGLPSVRSHRVGHDWSDLAAAAAVYMLPCYSLHSYRYWHFLFRYSCPTGHISVLANKKWFFKVWGFFPPLSVITPSSVQFSSVAQSCLNLCNPMDCGTPGFPVHHQLPELTQTHVHRVSDVFQPSHRLSSPSPPALNLSQHQGLFKWVSSLHQVAVVLEFQLQYHSFQWIFKTDFL